MLLEQEERLFGRPTHAAYLWWHIPLILQEHQEFLLEVEGIELKIWVAHEFLLDLLPYRLDNRLFSGVDLGQVSVSLGLLVSQDEGLN